jgi:hypothetical protein
VSGTAAAARSIDPHGRGWCLSAAELSPAACVPLGLTAAWCQGDLWGDYGPTGSSEPRGVYYPPEKYDGVDP